MNDPVYLIAGFGITWAALVWYTARIERRTRNAAQVWKKEGAGSPEASHVPPGASGAPEAP